MARASLGPGLDGILVVAKPAGPTSHDVVALVRRLAATKRVGHGGTLDPFASGVLPVFLGHGTRVVEYHLGDRKALPGDGLLRGVVDDRRPRRRADAGRRAGADRAAVEAALAGFRGAISQRPPAYSAIKVGGRRAYAMARAGETVELAEREVTIHALDLVAGTTPTRTARSRSSTSPARPGRTSGRSPATSARRSGSAAYLGALDADGVGAVPHRRRRRPRRRSARPPPTARPGSLPLLRPIDAASTPSRRSR